ncbi:MAG: BatD family protein [Prevotellaceae bacterium]|nr:BatD family protein [Prevotellaceae bacterium]
MGLLLLLFCGISAARADDVSLSVSAPRVVAVNEQFRATFSVNANVDNFTPPDFSGFHVIAGPSRSEEQMVQIINGKQSHTQTTRFIYVLQAVKEGNVTLGAASVAVDKKTYQSQPVTIEVVKAEDAPQAAQQPQQSAQPATGTGDGNDVFVRILVSKSNVYRGEYLTATVKIYSQSMNIAGFEDVKFPTFNGFWSQETEAPQQLQFQRENVNGKIYNSAVVRRYVLFPQQTGALKIDPFEITCALQVRVAPRSIFDDFFGSSAQIVRKHIASPVITVQVNPLPVNAPASFAGAVGTGFRMTAELARDSVTANDAASAIIKITGEGNVKLVEAPKIAWPPDFETYDVKISDNSKTSSAGVSGSKQFEIPFIPRSAGTFAIPPVEFTYFDIAKKQYVTLASKPLAIRVGKDPNAGAAVTVSGVNRQAVRALGEDIRYIKTDLPQWQKKEGLFFGSPLYYLLIAAEILVFILCCLFLSKRRKDLQNAVLVRNRKANKIARRRLNTAGRLLKSGNAPGFYEELAKALWGYLSDKLAIAAADLSRENARETLQNRQIPETDIETFLQVVDECEFARYAPAGSGVQMQKIYDDAIKAISRFEQKL